MRKNVPPFHLKVVKFPGELDLAFGLFRHQKLVATVQQMKICRNENELPMEVDTLASIEVCRVDMLNYEEKLCRVEGVAALCVNQTWFGRHSGYRFVFEVNLKTRTGLGAIWHMI